MKTNKSYEVALLKWIQGGRKELFEVLTLEEAQKSDIVPVYYLTERYLYDKILKN